MARPREFEPETAAEKAMHLFWEKGYFDTSIRELSDRTGVGPYGLYAEFGDKRGLFLASLDHYRKTVTGDILSVLEHSGPPEDRIRAAFERAHELMASPEHHLGCLMCNTAAELGPHDSDAARKVKEHLDLLRRSFNKVLARDGLPEPDVIEKAEILTMSLYSMALLIRSGHDADHVRRYRQSVLKILD